MWDLKDRPSCSAGRSLASGGCSSVSGSSSPLGHCFEGGKQKLSCGLFLQAREINSVGIHIFWGTHYSNHVSNLKKHLFGAVIVSWIIMYIPVRDMSSSLTSFKNSRPWSVISTFAQPNLK